LISDARLLLLTDSRFELQAKKEAPLFEVICYKESLAQILPDCLSSLHTKRLGFESTRLSFSQHKAISEALDAEGMDVELVGTENMVESFRMIKSESEIDSTRDALGIAETVFSDFIGHIVPGMTEKDAAWGLEKALREAGADSLSFPIICASGPNSALPHAIPGTRAFKAGEPILFDWGTRCRGYCSDISRTVTIGQPDDRFEQIYPVVYDAQQLAIGAIKEGVSSKAVDTLARDYIDQKGFGEQFGHALGHGTGLAIHEPPRLSPFTDSPLTSGMIVTVEPGIYLPEWGGVRIENMVVVREDGAEVLNTLNDTNFSPFI
ncbi:MAG: aminopeptidase P family protein, partial [Desulfobacterales bacterium]